MREIRTSIDIEAPAAQVWQHLTDLEAYPEWNPFMPVAEGTVAKGERLKVFIRPPGGRAMTFTPTVKEVVPEQTFRWLGRLGIPGLFDGEHIFELEALSEGRTRLVHREEFRGLLVPLFWSSLEGPTQQGFTDMNAALKARAEAVPHTA